MGNIGHHEKTHSESQEGDEEEEFHINVIDQILIKIKEENFKLRKDIPVQTQSAHRTPRKQEQKRNYTAYHS